MASICISFRLPRALLSLHGDGGTLAKMAASLDLAAQEQGSGSCIKHTSLNNVRADGSQAAAAEVSIRFSFALTSVLGPAKSLVSSNDCSPMQQAWETERQLANLVPRQAQQLVRDPGKLCHPCRYGRCLCDPPSCLGALWVVYR